MVHCFSRLHSHSKLKNDFFHSFIMFNNISQSHSPHWSDQREGKNNESELIRCNSLMSERWMYRRWDELMMRCPDIIFVFLTSMTQYVVILTCCVLCREDFTRILWTRHVIDFYCFSLAEGGVVAECGELFLSEWLLVVELGTDICQEEVEKGSNSFFYWRSLIWTEIKIEAFFNIEQFYEPQMPHIAIMLLLNKTKITRRSKWETNWSTLCRHYGRHRHYHDILLEKWSRK